MDCYSKMFVLAVVLGLLAPCFARMYILDDGQTGPRVKREKRQVLSNSAGVEYVFLQKNHPLTDSELNRSPRQSTNIQNARWELGYDPSDILHPPGLEPAETQYRTLNFYKKRKPEVETAPAIIWGTLKQGAVVNRPQRASPEGTRYTNQHQDEEEGEEEEEESSEAGYSQEGHSFHHVPASIYSFVKTDPHGNFKWGVHRGPPTRG